MRNGSGTGEPGGARPRRVAWVIGAVALVLVLLCGGGTYAVGRLAGFVRGGVSVGACHEDAETVATLRRLPMLTQSPPGSQLGQLQERLACGRPADRGRLDRTITQAGPSTEVSAFYATLAEAAGWRAVTDGSSVYAAFKPDGRGCQWELEVGGTARGVYHVRVSYQPRDLATACA
jgi:hypothetical protein